MANSKSADQLEFRPEKDFSFENEYRADGFLSFFHTRGATPSSFAPGYQYFAHTGLNTNLRFKELRATVYKSPFFNLTKL